ncbi:MAG TPA: MaoC/PaaZ C-terminal domain-containing protein [Burkholderiaceae bacterium]|nr:MaoC/PaaZ C-terminal domain-containing protein [Burkholderiaceae bacterium]
MIDYETLMRWPLAPVTQTYAERDTILYALGLGVARSNPVPSADLPYVYEDAPGGLQALPTLAAVLATGAFWMQDPATGIDWRRVLHGEQRLEIHRPVPRAATVVAEHRVDALLDKGAGKGAVMLLSRRLYEQRSGDLLATVGSTVLLRGDGGFGGRSDGAPRPHPLPDTRPPDLVYDHVTRPEQAMLYRLSGDLNPLHVDAQIALAAGFAQPILHGMCSYGMAGRAVIALLCDNDPARLRRLDLRFASPLFPGETVRTELWIEAPGRAAFRARVRERDEVILNNGLAEFKLAA